MSDLRHYEYIVALYEERSFKKAAEALHISTPAITKSIQKSEAAFNVRLFNRSPNGIVPTPFGEIVVRHMRMLLRDADAMLRSVRTLARLEDGQVRCGTYTEEALFGDVLGQFLSTYPGIRVDLKVEVWGNLLQMLNENEIDFFLSNYPKKLKNIESLRVIDLPAENIVWYCRPKHPLLKLKKITAKDIAAFPILAPIIPREFEDWILQLFKGTSLVQNDGTLAFGLQCNNIDVLKRAAAISNGVGALFRSSIIKEFHAGSLTELPFRPPVPPISLGLVYLKDRMMPPASERLIQMIKDEYLKRIKTTR